MTETVTHPTAQELAAFSLGKLVGARAAAVAAHLEVCPACCRAAAGVPGDSFVARVRDACPSQSPGGTRIPPPAAPAAPPDLPPELANHSRYRILRELGRGGMGVVYQARQTAMNRQVVIKVISKALLEHPDALERFRREVQAAAQLAHPNIVTAYDAEQAGELHMLIMEFIPGQSLAEVLEKKGPLPVTQACHYVRQAALGLQHAFERGMIHRDIKPQNLMLTPKGLVKILDFGLAKMVSEHRPKPTLTALNSYMGTPEYSAPEQATDARTADIRADVYSLGCTLYCLLAGHPPFQEDTAVKTILAHLEKEPRPLTELRPDVPAGLWAVVAKMLTKDPARRYQTPADVARALAPFCKPGAKAAPPPQTVPPRLASPDRATLAPHGASRLTSASPPAPKVPAPERPSARVVVPEAQLWQSPRLTAREPRNRLGCLAAAITCGVIGLAFSALLLGGVIFQLRTPEGVVLLENVPRNAEVFVDGRKLTLTVPGDSEPIRIELSEGQHELKVTKGGFEAFTRKITLPAGMSERVSVQLVREKVPEGVMLLESVPPEAGVFVDGQKLTVTVPGDSEPIRIELPEGKHELKVTKGGFKPFTRKVTLPAGMSERVSVQLVPEKVAVTAPPPLPQQPSTPPTTSTASADDKSTQAAPPSLHKPSEEPTKPNETAPVDGAALTLRGHTDRVVKVCFSPDGKRLASASFDGTVKVWDAQTGRELLTLQGHTGVVTGVCFSPDGKRLASASDDQTVKVWDAQTGQQALTLQGHTLGARDVCFSPDGRRLASASLDKTVKVWDAQTGQEARTLKGHTDTVFGVCFSPDGKRLASASTDRMVRVWDAQTGQVQLTLQGHASWVLSVCFSPDGKRLASASPDRTVRVWDAQTGQVQLTLQGHTAEVQGVCFSPDGCRLATGSWDRTVKVWNAQTGQEQLTLEGHTDGVTSVCFSPDGRRLASAARDQTVKVWDVSVKPAPSPPVAGSKPVEQPDGVSAERNGVGSRNREASSAPNQKDPVGAGQNTGNGTVVRPSERDNAKLRRAFATCTGNWKIEGSELVQEALEPKCLLVFGGFGWTDYDFTVRAKSVGNNDVGLIFRATGGGFNTFVPGGWGNTGSVVEWWESWHPEATHLTHHSGGEIMNDTWQTLRVSLRATECKCFVDGRLIHACEVKTNLRGAVGLRVWNTAARFKDIRVTDPAGTVLFEGLPELPASGGQWPPGSEPASGDEVFCLRGHGAPVLCLAFSRDGRQIISGSDGDHDMIDAAGKGWRNGGRGSTLRLWDTATGKEQDCSRLVDPLWANWQFTKLAVAAEGPYMLCVVGGGPVQKVQLWRITGGKVQPLPPFSQARGVLAVGFTPDGRRALALGVTGSLWEWDVTDRKLVRQVGGTLNDVTCAAIAPDGRIALLARKDQPLAEIDLATGKETGRWTEAAGTIWSLAFSSDGRKVLTGGADCTVRLWDVAGAKELHRFSEHEKPVQAVAFSPDGRRALSGGNDQTVRLWDLEAKRHLACYTGHTAPVRAVAFSPEGRRAASGSADYTVRLWRLPLP